MTAPDFYVIAEPIGTAYWNGEDGVVLGCPLGKDGTPDWSHSFDANASFDQAEDLLVGLTAIGEIVEFVKINQSERR